MKSLVRIIAIAYSILFCIGVVILIVFSTQVGLPVFSVSIVFGVAQLILIWALYSVLKRLDILENILLNKGVVEEQELIPEIEVKNDYDDLAIKQDPNIDTSSIRLCKNCGYQLFPEDTVCPLCGTQIDNDKTE